MNPGTSRPVLPLGTIDTSGTGASEGVGVALAECIHGFDEGMCDICFPRAAPEPVPAAASATRATTRATRATARTTTRTAPAGMPAKMPPFGSRRLYHATPLKNLESIALDGELRAVAAGVEPDVDLSTPIIRELRASNDVGDGRHVDEFVPFLLSPDAERWQDLRTGADGPQWSAAAGTVPATEYVLLVVTGKDLGDDVVIADGDASAPATRFTVGDPARAVARATRDDPELTAAEALVPGPVPLSKVSLIAVANEPMRARVRGVFRDVDGAAPRVVVHPPWFAVD